MFLAPPGSANPASGHKKTPTGTKVEAREKNSPGTF
jgi:hypothetical protein